MFVVDLPNPSIRIVRIPKTIDSSMPGGHAVVSIDNLRVPNDQMLGESGEGFKYAQVRLSPARLSHCMRWLGACSRAHDIATDYANRREAFGKTLIDHEGVGFMLAQNLIDLKQAELMIDWCAGGNRCWIARNCREFDDEGCGVGRADACSRPLRSSDGRIRSHRGYDRCADLSRNTRVSHL